MRHEHSFLGPALFSIGVLLLILSGFMCIPLAFSLGLQEQQSEGFLFGCIASLFSGGILKIGFQSENAMQFHVKTAFFFTATAWIAIAFFGAIPFFFSQEITSGSLGFLESVSALTTTGFSSFNQVHKAPVSIIVWRGILQWLGGIGITVMALTLFPFLRIGGMQLFSTESANHYEKLLPKVSMVAKFVLSLYTAMTIACIGLLCLFGMKPLMAFCYGTSAVSTSGMPMMQNGISYLENDAIVLCLTFFIFVSASPLLLGVHLLYGNIKNYFQDPQMRSYCKTILISSCLVILLSFFGKGYLSKAEIIKKLFYTLSMLTTSGFHDYHPQQWSYLIEAIFILLCLVGGCTGSTAGGIKIFRFQIIYRTIRAQVYKLIMPHGVFIPVYNKKTVTPEAINAVVTLVFLFVLHFFLLGIFLIASGMPITHSLELSANTLSNCGAHFFDLNLQKIPESTRWILSAGMILGRVEFLSVWILFIPFFWKR